MSINELQDEVIAEFSDFDDMLLKVMIRLVVLHHAAIGT